MNRTIMLALTAVAAGLIGPSAGMADEVPKGAIANAPSTARAFPYEQDIVDLLVTGSAAKELYDRLPGTGKAQECGALGLHKGDGKMRCSKDGQDYACHIWIDAKAQSLTNAETDDC